MKRQPVAWFFIVTIIFALFLWQCSDDKGIGFTPFEGITVTDSTGAIISEASGDWCYETAPALLVDFLSFSPSSLVLPCRTYDNTVSDNVIVFNNWLYDLDISVACTDDAIEISPETDIIPASGNVEFDISFTLTGDTIHEGFIMFSSVDPAFDDSLFFRAGYVDISGNPDDAIIIPTSFQMLPAYPNPTSGLTVISYLLPQAASVRITIYNSNRQSVVCLVNGMLAAGLHTVTWDASEVDPGIYKCVMESGDFKCMGDIEVE